MYTPVPIKRSSKYGNNYWEAYSLKLRRNVRLFSDLEYENWILIETDPEVIDFCEQPLRISYPFEGKMVESVFDMWVKKSDGSQHFIEVKYEAELDPANKKSARSIRQTTIQKAWCSENGFNHIIKTDRDIRGNRVYLANLKQMLTHLKNRKYPVETDQHTLLRVLKGQLAPISIRTLEESLPTLNSQRIHEIIFWLIFQEKIYANIKEFLFDSNTEVWCDATAKVN